MQQTRGVAGFYDGDLKLIYQNDHAEPEKLGIKILNELRAYGQTEALDFIEDHVIDGLRSIEEYEPATGQHKQYFRRHFPRELVRENASTAYDLFEPLQGTLKPWLDGLIHLFPNGSGFIKDSRFCKWGYVLNVENGKFEILQGDQTENLDETPVYGIKDHSINTYYAEDLPYHTCSIVQAYDVRALPSEEQFLRDLEKFRS